MVDSTENEPTYIEVVCEAKINNTEKEETIVNILKQFIEGDPFIDERFDGNYMVIRNSKDDSLQVFADWVRELKQLDTVRKRLFNSMVGNLTALYFNRQAAAMHRLALVDVNDRPPLGPITLNIVSDSLDSIINMLTPKTHKGKELTNEQWQKIKERKEQKTLSIRKKQGKIDK
ncbi:MAG: hypothetical protein ACXAD7_05605 [Candidatus Kariarchaeaceae archaeon]|jgi:predicted RNA binding protein with dsRBD fold (UPF0201 family)